MDKKNLYGVIFDTKAQEVYSEVYDWDGDLQDKTVTPKPKAKKLQQMMVMTV